MPLNLIDKALQYAREERQWFERQEGYITEPLFPDARNSVRYLRIRECLIKGCRRAVKLLPKGWKRSVAFSVLMQATFDIFHYGYDKALVEHYNMRLDELIGTH